MVSELAAFYILKRSGGTICVVEPKLWAMVAPGVELSEITVQELLSAMTVRALHAAVENTEEAFDSLL